ncbi:uncharacterized protein [Polyergus mexicanus]|uniref:uncharacterized protein n=1 Tax=Polyergus mexicanus TaxID=615972 RepID=UPI0038B580CF
MRAGCHIKLLREITMKRAVINGQSNDNACFAWSVVAALHPAENHVYRESSYPHYTTVLNLQDIEFPVTVNQIKKFELINDISINVYSIEEKNIVPIRLSELKKDKHVNLLYNEDNNVGHFAWIKNLSRLVSSQLSCGKRRQYICDRCLHYFGSNDKLQLHTVDCREMNECAIRLPSDKDKWLTFNNYNRKERLPFIVYADLECVLEKTEKERNYQHHKVFSIAYYVHCSYDNSLSRKSLAIYVGSNGANRRIISKIPRQSSVSTLPTLAEITRRRKTRPTPLSQTSAKRRRTGARSPPAKGAQSPPAQGIQSPPAKGAQSPPAKGARSPPILGTQSPSAQGARPPPAPGAQRSLVLGDRSAYAWDELPTTKTPLPLTERNHLPGSPRKKKKIEARLQVLFGANSPKSSTVNSCPKERITPDIERPQCITPPIPW